MKSFASFTRLGRALVLLAALPFAASAQIVTPSFHLAYTVDTREGTANHNKLGARDLHDDHYHAFVQNNGTPGSHVPLPLAVDVSGGFGAISLAAWNDSPENDSPHFHFPTEGVAFDLHLELVSVSSASLIVALQHDDHYHTLAAGGEGEHLHFGEYQNLRFSFSEGAALGDYSAVFRIVDEAGIYTASNDFTVHVSAVPEPSSFAALGGAFALATALLRRRRHA